MYTTVLQYIKSMRIGVPFWRSRNGRCDVVTTKSTYTSSTSNPYIYSYSKHMSNHPPSNHRDSSTIINTSPTVDTDTDTDYAIIKSTNISSSIPSTTTTKSSNSFYSNKNSNNINNIWNVRLLVRHNMIISPKRAFSGISSSSDNNNSDNSDNNTGKNENNANPQSDKCTDTSTRIVSDENQIKSIHDDSISTDDLNLAMQEVTQQSSAAGSSTTNTTTEKEDATTHTLNLDSIPGTSKGKRQLAIIYTCNVCNTRAAKKFTEQAYNHGVVLVRCPNCQSLHLIADRLGFFTDSNTEEHGDSGGGGKGWDIQTFMKNIGKEENVKVVTRNNEEVLEVTMDDMLGHGNDRS